MSTRHEAGTRTEDGAKRSKSQTLEGNRHKAGSGLEIVESLPAMDLSKLAVLTPDAILTLQQSAGNQALLQKLAETQREESGERSAPRISPSPSDGVQRKSSTGLAAAKATKEFAGAAHDYCQKNKDAALTALADYLMDKVNGMLTMECLHTFGGSDSGSFNRVTWSIKIGTDHFTKRPNITKVGQLNTAEVAEIVDTIYHEARHSEQYFQIARMKAGEGMKGDDIAKAMSIPPEVAYAAEASPLKGDTKAGKKELAEAKGWEAITVGKYGDYKGRMNTLGGEVKAVWEAYSGGGNDWNVWMGKIGAKMATVKTRLDGFFATQKTKIEAIKKKDQLDKTVLKHINAVNKAYDALKTEYDAQLGNTDLYAPDKLKKLILKLYDARYAAYRDFEHEKDAWATGAAAGKAYSQKAKAKAK